MIPIRLLIPRRSFPLALFAVLPLSLTTATAKPSLFWISSPVGPNETVYLQGDGLDAAMVEYAPMPNGDPDKSGDTGTNPAATPVDLAWKKVTPIKASASAKADGSSLFFVLPKSEQMGAFQIRLGGKSGTLHDLNLPDIWWNQGEAGRSMAYPGSWLRLFGRSLHPGEAAPSVMLTSASGRIPLAHVSTKDAYSLEASLPADLPAGSYSVLVHNGYGGASGWRSAGDLTVTNSPNEPKQIFDVTKYGAIPNDGKDQAASIQGALDAAGKAGGGVVLIPAGRYMVSVGLILPQHVTLRGESEALTVLQWYDYGIGTPKQGTPDYVRQGTPPDALIKGEGNFNIEDLTMHSWSHFHGIWAQHWNGVGNVHLKRVRIRLNETAVNFGRFFANKEGEQDAEFQEMQARRARRKGLWTAAFQAGGPNISVEECDFESNSHGIIIDNGHGVVIRNNRLGNVFTKGTDSMILEENTMGPFWNSTHSSSQDPFRRWKLGERKNNSSTQYLYMARNHAKNASGDREITSIDAHGPFGMYLGPVVKADGKTIEIKDVDASGQKPLRDAPVGYAVYIIDGKGAGQYRRVTGGGGTTVQIDHPFDVAPDISSVISIAKYHGELLYIDNDFTDAGDIQIWGGAVHTVFKNTTMTRCGGYNQAGGFIFGGVIPIWYVEQIDTHVIEGSSPGGPPFKLRAADLSMNTYRHAEFYQGPCVRGAILRHTLAENGTKISITGAVQGALIEDSLIKNNDLGIVVEGKASYYKDPALQKEYRAPSDIVLRDNTFEKVTLPYSGNEIKKATIIP